MHFSAASCCLASLVAILVAMTMSLPQSPSSLSDGISRRTQYPIDPYNFRPRKGCFGIGSIDYHEDLGGKLVKRDSKSLETHIGTLESRTEINLPCGRILVGGQSDMFGFTTARVHQLLWNFAGAPLRSQLVMIMQVNKHGPDRLIKQALARNYRLNGFKPVKGASYYVVLSGRAHPGVTMTWFFSISDSVCFSVPLCWGALANPALQKPITDLLYHYITREHENKRTWGMY